MRRTCSAVIVTSATGWKVWVRKVVTGLPKRFRKDNDNKDLFLDNDNGK